MKAKKNIIVGYSGHAFVVVNAMLLSGLSNIYYCENEVKNRNPHDIGFSGQETQDILNSNNWIVGIGNNQIRAKIIRQFNSDNLMKIIHPSAIVAKETKIGKGTFISANAVVNPLAKIGVGCIINTSAVVEHECEISDFVHIAPGAVLAGCVTVGKRSFVGANATVKQGVIIGEDVTIGAGSVVLSHVESGSTVVGNPARKI